MNALQIEFHRRYHTPAVTRFVAEHYSKVSHFDFESLDSLHAQIEMEDIALAGVTVTAVARSGIGEIVSTARLIERTDGRPVLPVERVFAIAVSTPDPSFGRVMELARFVSTPTGERGIVWRLAAGLYQQCALDPERDVVVAGIDAQLLGVLDKRGWPLEPIGDARFYLGSKTVPIRIDLEAAVTVMGKRALLGDLARTTLSGG
jgi:N-acyl-L-homoserine lactone synthetase